MDDESDDFPIGIVDGKPVLASEDYDDILEDADVSDKLSDVIDATFGRTSPNSFGKLANEVRKKAAAEAAGRKFNVYRIQKNGKRATSPSGYGGPFTEEGAKKEVERLKQLNPRNDYVVGDCFYAVGQEAAPKPYGKYSGGDGLADLLERARSGVREQTGDGLLRSVLDVSMRDGQAERIAGAWALFNRPGTPGEKAAAEAALKRMGIDPSKGQAGAYAPAGKTYSSSSGSSYTASGTAGPSQSQQKREYFRNRWVVVLEYTVVNDFGKTVTTKMAETVTANSETEARQAGVQAAMATWKMLVRNKPTPTFSVVQCKRA